ncbi:hypothetical protein FQA39_LY00529 [Lamprigera yunnana]|nr:hypothetical protein FQA39_LY00529 [Lamprigera yunnana]
MIKLNKHVTKQLNFNLIKEIKLLRQTDDRVLLTKIFFSNSVQSYKTSNLKKELHADDGTGCQRLHTAIYNTKWQQRKHCWYSWRADVHDFEEFIQTTLNDVLDESASKDECGECEHDTENEKSEIEENVTHENESSNSETEVSYWNRNNNFEWNSRGSARQGIT